MIVTWNSEFPDPIPEDQLLSDLSTAYNAGATYDVVITFNRTETLPSLYLNALQNFWSGLRESSKEFGSERASIAYVVPANFGFGFRSAQDTIWGLFPASSYPYTQKIWNDTQTLLTKYEDMVNIIFDNQTVIQPKLKQYSEIYYYNQSVT